MAERSQIYWGRTSEVIADHSFPSIYPKEQKREIASLEVLEPGHRKSEHLGLTRVAFQGTINNFQEQGSPPQRARKPILH